MKGYRPSMMLREGDSLFPKNKLFGRIPHLKCYTFTKEQYYMDSVCSLLLSALYSLVIPCVSHHIQQTEASRMRDERRTDPLV